MLASPAEVMNPLRARWPKLLKAQEELLRAEPRSLVFALCRGTLEAANCGRSRVAIRSQGFALLGASALISSGCREG